ncbi:LacI family transcriptional regulator [Nocardioides sp. HDW12B]|uniref:LacI family DNA-binding transcriptional regulator n=1 Tax=Nocardioides sp. HDW12B TaxID=2714939 RepID=UPI00140ADA3F|nr:LacI family DNA-binding transcriptional regulator [Nocardioides sp. HDW12B]QIK65173.1 LacI family transcriptional regulator [Nocardioides sp. HDW12B]
MRGRHRVTDIAAQAGLSRATVDRVLHGRPGVRPETVTQVERAIEELDRQRAQVELSGRPLILDLVMQAPPRFAVASQQALEAELRSLRPAVVRARSHLNEDSDPRAAAQALDDVRRRGSHGVVLKAPDHPEVADAVDRVVGSGVPVVTFVTDVSGSRRAAYVGVDNRAAGATAAYLVTRWAGTSGDVLVTLSSSSFRGEEERETGFREALARLAPERRVVEVSGTDGRDAGVLAPALAALRAHGGIDAVYSAGGGNDAILEAFAAVGRDPTVFVVHDLDEDNRRLLRAHRVSAVLHHDLRGDLRRACRLLLQAGGRAPGAPTTRPSQIQVVTPFNEPPGLVDDRDDR